MKDLLYETEAKAPILEMMYSSEPASEPATEECRSPKRENDSVERIA
jgi:hypothetical protein